MSDQKYNGWTNYETWCVNLWMDNEEGTHDYWREQAKELRSRIGGSTLQPRRLQWELADMLKTEHEEALPDLQGFAADLLNAAMSEVNWDEIATSLLADIEEDFDDDEAAA